LQIERYGVYWVNLDPIVGREMAKRRPAVVVSDEGMNQYLDTVVVCPLTSTRHPRWRSRVGCTIAGVEGEVAVDQIRTVSRARLGGMLGTLDDSQAASIRHIITEMYGVLSVSSVDVS
jgi:mRNA interferase MazF